MRQILQSAHERGPTHNTPDEIFLKITNWVATQLGIEFPPTDLAAHYALQACQIGDLAIPARAIVVSHATPAGEQIIKLLTAFLNGQAQQCVIPGLNGEEILWLQPGSDQRFLTAEQLQQIGFHPTEGEQAESGYDWILTHEKCQILASGLCIGDRKLPKLQVDGNQIAHPLLKIRGLVELMWPFAEKLLEGRLPFDTLQNQWARLLDKGLPPGWKPVYEKSDLRARIQRRQCQLPHSRVGYPHNVPDNVTQEIHAAIIEMVPYIPLGEEDIWIHYGYKPNQPNEKGLLFGPLTNEGQEILKVLNDTLQAGQLFPKPPRNFDHLLAQLEAESPPCLTIPTPLSSAPAPSADSTALPAAPSPGVSPAPTGDTISGS